jgi:hypothetical protein
MYELFFFFSSKFLVSIKFLVVNIYMQRLQVYILLVKVVD